MSGGQSSGLFDRIYDLVETVPAGRVTTYGDVSRALVGHAGAARTVGWALHGLSEDRLDAVPWWRVISARGVISTSCVQHAAAEQRARLEAEGIVFDADGRVDLARFAWDYAPRAHPAPTRRS